MKLTMKQSLIAYVVIVVIIGIIPLLVASFYNHPSADDFSYSLQTHSVVQSGNIIDVIQSAWATSMQFMQVWQGLYSSAFILSLQPAIFGDSWYVITCPLLLVISLVGFLAIIFALAKYILKTRSKAWIAIALLLWLYFVEQMPSPVEGLYWYNGAMNYTLFWSLAAITISLMIRYYYLPKQSISCVLIASITSFVVAGGNHVTSFGTILMLAYIAAWSIIKKRRFASLIPLIICIFGFVIVMTAPGTQIRADAINVDRSVVWTLFHAATGTIRFVGDWTNLRLGLAFVMMFPFLFTACKQSDLNPKFVSGKTFIGILVLALFFLFAQLCVPMYSLKSHGDGRLINVLFATFLILSVMLFALGLCAFQKRSPHSLSWLAISDDRTNIPIIIVMSLAITFILLSPGSWLSATSDFLNGSFKTYDNEMKQRYELLLEGQDTEVVLPELSSKPELIYFDDITSDPEDFRNVALAEYFGKMKVVLSEKTSE